MLSFLPIGITAGVVYAIFAVVRGYKKQIPLGRQALAFIFFAYLMGVAAITLFPIPVDAQVLDSLRRGSTGASDNILPLKTILAMLRDRNREYSLLNLGGNILLFAPFGFLFPIVSKKPNRFFSIVLWGFPASCMVECCQLIISRILKFTYRSFDVDDILLNTAGVLLGLCIFKLFHTLIRRRPRLRFRKAFALCGSILLVLASVFCWGYEYDTHRTPVKAQECYDSHVLPIETVVLPQGVVLITSADPSTFKLPGHVAWYMKKSPFGGWRLRAQSEELLSQPNASLVLDGQTFVWGIYANPGEAGAYEYKGKSYPYQANERGFWHILETP